MDALSLLDTLHADPRPTCVLDLHKGRASSALACMGRECALEHIVHKNEALLTQHHLVHDIIDPSTATHLRSWTVGKAQIKGPRAASGHFLYAYTIHERWRVIQWMSFDVGEKSGDPSLKDAIADRDGAAARLRCLLRMMEMVDVGIWEYNMRGKLLYGNEAYYNLSGHPRDSTAEDTTWEAAVFPEDHDWLMEKWIGMTQGISSTFEMKWKRPASAMPDGREDTEGQWVLAACVPTRNEQGEVTAISGCLADIAAQKRNQAEALKRAEALERAAVSEKRFGNFCEFAPVAIWILNLEMEMQFCNREWYNVTGHPVTPFSNIDWSLTVSENNRDTIMSNWQEMLHTKSAVKFQYELKRHWSDGQGGGMRAWVLATAYPELDKNGEIKAVAGTLTDITHLRWAETIQKQRTDEAVEAKRQQESFIDMTCHEIRNPLGAVVHCADLVRSSLMDLENAIETESHADHAHLRDLVDSAVDAINIVFSCCAHQKRIVDDILTLSKLDSKLVTIAPAPVKLDDILNELSRMFEADSKKADVELRTVKEASLNLIATEWAALDAGRLMQVLINLITNALKFTQKEAERTISLTVGASRHKPAERDLGVEFTASDIARDPVETNGHFGNGEQIYLHFTVRDTGCGFDEEQKGRIFKRFSQASPRTHTKYGGSGLGLFISREMIELQGGEIGVASVPGKGATFAFYIASQIADAPKTEQDTSRHKRIKSETLKSGSSKYNILVVEDNLVNQKVLRMQLQKLGHTVHVVNHGGEALNSCKLPRAGPATHRTIVHRPPKYLSSSWTSKCLSWEAWNAPDVFDLCSLMATFFDIFLLSPSARMRGMHRCKRPWSVVWTMPSRNLFALSTCCPRLRGWSVVPRI
ncbi:hypothetical protein AC579_6011 [Pseudocercospora musae]|uniref:histidine kinase n=1 Tax=Pseudocercospora musae TaxID=113226 RepID=A0A139H743_9PEZI|nr:hypothetical protein AC579_6011 [Pseudocercospora musae]